MIELREYQVRAVESVRQRMRAGISRLVLVAPTGSGKTVIASHIIEAAKDKGSRVVFLAHRRELIVQCYNKLQDAGIPVDQLSIIMGQDKRANKVAPVQVCSVDTLRNREKPPCDLLIIDECHRSCSQTYRDLIAHYLAGEERARLLGLTATPYRADGQGLGDMYEALEVVSTPQELIYLGFLVKPRVLSLPKGMLPDLSHVRTSRGDYDEGQLSAAVDQGALVGNIVEHWREHARGMRTVAFATSVSHSRHIVERFGAANVSAEHLDGNTPTAERDAILARLRAGMTLVCSNVGVLCEGWDMPEVKCAILARPTKSTGLYLQQAGRILRPWHGHGALILDHAGNALCHGLPHDDRSFDLQMTKEKKEKEREDKARQCPECNEIWPRRQTSCPTCGFEWPATLTEEQEGRLVEIQQVEVGKMVAAWNDMCAEWKAENDRRVSYGKKRMKSGKIYMDFKRRYGQQPPAGCDTPIEEGTQQDKLSAFEHLVLQGKEKGYKPGWASWMFKRRFGHWPTWRTA
jgi:DNA repair protein RadD